MLALRRQGYVEDGVYAPGSVATSPLLDGFGISVGDVFDVPEPGA